MFVWPMSSPKMTRMFGFDASPRAAGVANNTMKAKPKRYATAGEPCMRSLSRTSDLLIGTIVFPPVGSLQRSRNGCTSRKSQVGQQIRASDSSNEIQDRHPFGNCKKCQLLALFFHCSMTLHCVA